VVDQQAYSEYAAQLRRLLDDTAQQSVQLRAAAQEASLTQAALQRAAADQQPRIDGASRTLAAIEARLAQAERMSQSAQNLEAAAGAQLAALRQGVDQLAQAKLAEVNIRLEKAAREAEDRLRAAEAQANQIIAGAELRARQISQQAAESASQRLSATLEAMLAQHTGPQAMVQAQVGAQVGAAVQAHVQRVLDARLSPTLIAEVDARATHIERRLEQLSRTSLPDIDLDRAERLLTELTDVTGRASAEAEAAQNALAGAREAADRAGAGAHTAGQSADARAAQLRSLTEQAELVRQLMARSINEAAQQVDELLQQADSVKQTAAAIGPACTRAEERIGATLRQMEVSAATAQAVVGDAGQLVSRLGAVIHDAVEKAKGRIMTEAADISAALNDAAARMARYSASLGR
jgi:F0F1-type ATP synthase membrane subunit b/b'